MQRDDLVAKENLQQIITTLGEEELGKRIKTKDLGVDIFDELENKTLTVKKLIDYFYNTKYAMKTANNLLKDFKNVKIAEYYENTFKIKIYKQSDETKTIGYVFGTIEDNVRKSFYLILIFL